MARRRIIRRAHLELAAAALTELATDAQIAEEVYEECEWANIAQRHLEGGDPYYFDGRLAAPHGFVDEHCALCCEFESCEERA